MASVMDEGGQAGAL